MASPGMPGASKLSSTINITIAAPTFYSPQKKFAPVVAPKPKANPYKASSRPEPAPPVTALPSASSSRAWLGRVGDPPAAGLGDDLPLPPPPPADEGHLPPPGYIPPPPPPPPPPFEDSFPPPPVEETFPSPPPPLEEEPPAADWSRDTEAAGSSSLDAGSSFESQIDTLNSMLNEMQNNDPYKAKVAPAAPGVNGNVGVSVRQGPASDSPPGAPASSRFGPRVAGFSPVKAPKPQAVGPKPQPGPPPAPWAGPAKQRLPAGGPPAPSPPAPAQDRAAPPAGEGGPGNKRHQHSEGPAEQPKSTRNRAEQKEEPRVQEQRDRGPGFLSSKGDDNPAPFTYRDVEELENLTKQFMQEMDKNPKNSTGRTEICSRCRKELSRTEPAVKAMGKMFHVSCFLCNSCHQELKGQQFYEVDGEPLCEGCHSSTLEKCDVCHQPITERMLKATGRNYHPKCFTCTECHKGLEGQPFIVDQETKVYCVQDYHRKFAPRCSVCDEPIIPEDGKEESVRIIALNKNFHVKCYRCEDCKKQLSSEANEDGCYPLDDHILCLKCHTSRVNKGLRD